MWPNNTHSNRFWSLAQVMYAQKSMCAITLLTALQTQVLVAVVENLVTTTVFKISFYSNVGNAIEEEMLKNWFLHIFDVRVQLN